MLTPYSQKLLAWYDLNRRKMPWRDHPDPYAVWVSEIMLQQTRVETVIPYFIKWMERFPGLVALAAASEQDVLNAWEGLGYYLRARNLHKAAREIIAAGSTELPRDLEALRKLPGIGRYTAGAIASMAYQLDVPTLDGNIRRVYSRLFNIDVAVNSSAGEKILWNLADMLLPAGRAGDYNQALMDLGATVCLPRDPACPACPLLDLCQAKTLGVVDLRPVMVRKKKIPHYVVTAAVISRGDKVLLSKRPSRGLLGGMWEFPGGKIEKDETLEECLVREIHEELGVDVQVGEPMGVYQHAYTHFRITLHAFKCQLIRGEPIPREADDLAWVLRPDLDDYPMGKVDRQIARRIQVNQSG